MKSGKGSMKARKSSDDREPNSQNVRCDFKVKDKKMA